ncbi:50S ribosomal protein L22 [Candidatus Woesearchaeota archaeon]|nr:50S ribosomal protein L22 [Candidatus Woesearchaeota archaeon]
MKKYSAPYSKEHHAKAQGVAMPISTKASIEICNTLRRKTVGRAKVILENVLAMKDPISFKRFTGGAGHKKGMGPGKYPLKAAEHILSVLKDVEANAQFKGLNTGNLILIHIAAHNAGNVWRYGRHRRRKMKRTHIEVIVEEGKVEKRAAPVKKEAPKAQPKPVEKVETKPVVNPVVKKAEPKAKKVEAKPAVEKKTEPLAAPAEQKKEAPKEKPAEQTPKVKEPEQKTK